MKSNSTAKTVVHLLVAAIFALVLPTAVRAESPDGQPARTELAANTVDSALAQHGAVQLALGNQAYARGEYDAAFRLYRSIAVLGIPEAHYRLGLMYIDGVGTRKSIRQAEYWLNLAAIKNHPGAAEALNSVKTSAAQG